MPLEETLALTHAAATCALTGFIWTVQLLVYPGFRESGPTPSWPAVHAAHVRRITPLVAVPWAVQGVSVGGLLLRPSPLVVLAGALALATVVVTALVSVPLHRRLDDGWEAAAAERLTRTNWLRTVAWTGAAACALALLP